MPKTADEYDQEIKDLKENHKGQLDALKKQNTDALAHTTGLETEVKDLKGALSGYKKNERDALEAEAHTLVKDYDCEGKEDSSIQSWIDGFKSATKSKDESHAGQQKAGQTSVPNGGGTPAPTERDRVDEFLDA